MSTKLSGDMMWEKSSTRRFAPPGGQTSISLGNYDSSPGPQTTPVTKGIVNDVVVTPTPIKPRVNTSAVVVSSATAKSTSTTFQAVASGGSLQIGVVVCEAAGLKAATVAALCKLGAKPVVYEVADPLQLPFAAQCMVEKRGVAAVVVIGFLVAESHWCCKEVAGSLVKTLLELSLQLKVPLINGLNFSHVMAGDVISIGEGLARGAVDMAAVREGLKDTYTVSRTYPSVDSSPAGSTERGLDMKSDKKPSVFGQSRSVPSDLESLLLGLKTALKAHGAKGIFGLARRFRISDRDKSGSIDFHEFQVCMRDMHMDWTEDELKNVFEHFDGDGSKAINYEEFLFAVRGQVNERRAQLILEAFDVLDKDKSGIINSADLQGVYDASKHPDVIAGKSTEADILEQFMSTFEGEVKDGKVTPEEWCRYYAMLSASMNTDDEFELMMRNAWHLPGGKGPLTNTSAKRVLVTRADGSQTVEVVNGGLAATGMDKKGILRSLRSRGLAVTGVDFFGKLETTEPATTTRKSKNASSGGVKPESPIYAPPVRQRPGGNSSLVLG